MQKKQQYDAIVQGINAQNTIINQKEQDITNKNTAINLIENTLNNYRNEKVRVDAKKKLYDDLVRRKNNQETEVANKTADVTNAENALNPLRKNGSQDQFISFFDMLLGLDWSSSKPESELATDLKAEVDNKFNNVFSQFNQADYEKIVSLYKRREGQISGSKERLLNELKNDLTSIAYRSGKNGVFYTEVNKLIDSYYKNENNNTNYIANLSFDYFKNGFEDILKRRDQYDNNQIPNLLSELGTGIFSHQRKFDYASMKNEEFTLASFGDDLDLLSSSNGKSSNVRELPAEYRNTIILLEKSLAKAKKTGEFTPLVRPTKETYGVLFNLVHGKRDGRTVQKLGEFLDNDEYILYRSEIYRNNSNFNKEFVDRYNTNLFLNHSFMTGVRFGFKKVGSNDLINVITSDLGAIQVLNKLESNSTDIYSFLNSEDIKLFKAYYDGIKEYKNNIDWGFTNSAIDLADYQQKLNKVEAYYEKLNGIVRLYEEIIEERQKPSGGNQNLLDQKSRELLGLKKQALDGMSDITNFMAGVKLTYTDKAREYLEYGKEDADRMVKELNDELSLYDPNAGVIKAVTDKIDSLRTDYKNAKLAKKEAESALNNLNDIVRDNELTPEEKALDTTISNKERKKQDLENERIHLENEKQTAETRLNELRDELSRSNIANLGKNSYAHGHNAFASGDNSIAIGTEAVALGNNSIAMGHKAQASAEDSIAMGREAKAKAEGSVTIGQSAVVKHANSVAIGKGSSTSIGARGAKYAAPIGNDQTANFSLGSIGEFSVGSADGLRQITHVAAGVEDTDAVNVWQLKAAIAAIPRADNNNAGGQPAQPQPSNVEGYNVSGNNITTVNNFKDAFDHINEQGIKYVHVNAGAKKAEPADRSNNDSSASGANSVAIGRLANAVGDKSVALGDNAESRVDNSVALGADSQTSQAKDDNTLGVGNPRDKDIIDNLNDTVNQYAGNAVGVVSVGKKGGERIIQNVAAGLVGANSTDAVNGSQLHALAQAVGRGETGLVRQGSDTNRIVNGVNHNRLTVGAGTGGNEISFTNVDGQARRLTGVAEGVEATDAVNKSQLDRAMGQLSSRLEKTDKQLKGGISNVAAMASLPQAYLPSQGMVSVATGYYRGSSSVAVGLSRVSDNGRVVFKLNGSASQKGDVTAGAGIGFAW